MNCSNCGKTFWKVEIEETPVETGFKMVSIVVKTKEFTCIKCGLRWYSSELDNPYPEELKDS